MSCGWCGYICVKRAGCRTDSDWGCSRVNGSTGAPHPIPGWGTSPSAIFLLRPWAVVVRATVVGVAGRCRN